MQTLRLEKVKQKGLQEFAEQMNDCLREQKQTEEQLQLAEIVHSDKLIEELAESMKEYEQGLEQAE